MSAESQVDDDLKRDILGARRRILFIEGTEQSLDKTLYSLVFPDVTVIAKGSCRDVIHAVRSIRDAKELHWVSAFGLIDNDRRSTCEMESLKSEGVYALSVFSVESVYYHPLIQRRVAERQATITGGDAAQCAAEAQTEALKAIRNCIEHLSKRAAEKRVREEFFAHTPKKGEISADATIKVSIDIGAIIVQERERLQRALEEPDLLYLISYYPLRETPSLQKIAQTLGFKSRTQYESAVRKLLADNADALSSVKSMFGTLPSDIAGGTSAAGRGSVEVPTGAGAGLIE